MTETTKRKKVGKKVSTAAAKATRATRPAARRSKTAAGSASARAAAGGGDIVVVVESPAKAKTIKKYLGPGYRVLASVGHVKDLPKSSISVDLEHDFVPRYEVIRGKSKVLKEIKDAARGARAVYLAPDPDREGEAIAWHIAEELGRRPAAAVQRIIFNEITERAVRAAVANPRDLDVNKFASQQARRILDRIVGYQISPILWDKVRRGLSAGRVQSVATRLCVDRDQAIAAFCPEEHWSVEGTAHAAAPPPFTARVVTKGGEKYRPSRGAEAQADAALLAGSPCDVAEVQRRERRRKPSPPLITSKLQQEAAGRLRFTAKRTMMVAQQLYEGVELGDEGAVGLITYMRTDSTRLSPDAQQAARAFVGERYGADHLPAEPPQYRGKKNAQDAHEAIRPTSLAWTPERVQPFVSVEQFRLYQLIWRFFLASQMAPAVFDQTSVEMRCGPFGLRASGSVLKFPGFLAAHGGALEDEESTRPAAGEEGQGGGEPLPELAAGDRLSLADIAATQHFTQPPPRFSESTLVRELEERGIGRPSTYATILSTIVSRGYVEKIDGRFHPTELGRLITELLLASFPTVMDVAFTAHMEEQLDEVETGKVDWVALLRQFYHGGFKEALARAATEMRDVKREETPTDHLCEACNKTMLIKWGRNGSFLACSGYPDCRNTRDYKRLPDGTIEVLPEPTTSERCPSCQGPMVVKRGRFGEFYACENYPECKGTRPLSIGVGCPNDCGGYIAERRSKRGRVFFGCSQYPACTFAAWSRPVPGPCPTCQHSYLIRNVTKKDGVMIKCPNKGCAYRRDPELDDQDARAVAG